MCSARVFAFLLALTVQAVSSRGPLSSAVGQGPERPTILREVEKTFGDPPGMVRLDPVDRVWADKKSRRVIVDGYIALREGPLEMLACLVGTKEHESIVATLCKAQTVHVGLLAVGAEQGKPVQWDPTYVPPTGSEIQVFALWRDKAGQKKNIDTRQWLRVMGTESDVLEENFVFAGSIFWEDPETHKKIYQAESGDLICVSNFSTATLDVPIESSKVNSGLMFVTFTERIPELGTPIRLVLQVVDGTEAPPASAAGEKNTDPVNSSGTTTNPQKLPSGSIAPLPDLKDLK